LGVVLIYIYTYGDTGHTISVSPFIGKLGQLNDIPIVIAVIPYGCPLTYQTYILFLFLNSLYVKDLDHHFDVWTNYATMKSTNSDTTGPKNGSTSFLV
jgi:hypothetical protein